VDILVEMVMERPLVETVVGPAVVVRLQLTERVAVVVPETPQELKDQS
jgi:hypothetical protein